MWLVMILPWAANVVLRALRFLHLSQLEEYKNVRFGRWLIRRWAEMTNLVELCAVTVILAVGVLIGFLSLPGGMTLPLALWVLLNLYLILSRKRVEAKKPLVLTARARRILAGTLLLPGLEIVGLGLLCFGRPKVGLAIDWPPSALIFILASTLVGQTVGWQVILANVLLYPVETFIQSRYLREARGMVQRYRPQVIAITGSYGKTSTKEIVSHLLATRYHVLKTPGSYNTLMGICRVIRGDLRAEHEVFVVEMGTYRKGEIAELCELVPPEIGVLTAVGPQHLERFKTVERVAQAKYELIEALPAQGVAVFNNDDERCRQLADLTMKTMAVKVVRYGLEQAAGLRAGDVSFGPRGLEFTVEADNGEKVAFRTRLLGRHNVSNILAATAVALECGLTLKEIGRAVATLEPAPHRLQLIAGRGGVTVIDDAYSANPVGAQMALEVLGTFEGGAKVLVTPGLIELGDVEYEQNRLLGLRAAEVCDHVLLVGPQRTRPIAEGLEQAGFPAERLAVFDSLEEATARLQSILKPGDVVLFENDLTDLYDDG